MSVERYVPANTVNISLSDAAKARLIKVIQATEGAIAMRLAVKKTGCSGYSYDLQPVNHIQAEDFLIHLDDSYKLCIDPKSYPLLQGVRLDYIKQGIQTKFVYENPLQTGQCGCGESFTVEKKA